MMCIKMIIKLKEDGVVFIKKNNLMMFLFYGLFCLGIEV